MSFGFVVALVRGSIFELLILVTPVLLISLVVGLVVSIIQATTSIQDQTLSFVPKILAIFIVIALFGPWMMGSLMDYTIGLFSAIPQMR